MSRVRLGMIYPASGLMEVEFLKIAPPEVSVHITRIHFERASIEENFKMMQRVGEAARLLSLVRPDLILLNCTTGSLIGGTNYDKAVTAKIESEAGTPALTTTTAVVLALRALGIRKMGLLAPYPPEIVEVERQFFVSSGFEVIWSHAENIADPHTQGTTHPSKWIDLSHKLPADADGLFISCAGIEIVDQINEMEERLHKPVVTSNQALMWACLRKLGIQYKTPKFGKLMMDL